MDEKYKQLEDRIKALEADRLAVVMSVNSDTNLYRSWLRTVMGRVNIGIGTSNANTSTIMDIASTSLAFRLPCMTTTQRDAIQNPEKGFLIYNTTTNALNDYDGSVWAAV